MKHLLILTALAYILHQHQQQRRQAALLAAHRRALSATIAANQQLQKRLAAQGNQTGWPQRPTIHRRPAQDPII